MMKEKKAILFAVYDMEGDRVFGTIADNDAKSMLSAIEIFNAQNDVKATCFADLKNIGYTCRKLTCTITLTNS